MSEEYPLYPTLSEEGQKEADAIIQEFKNKLKKAADEAISGMYCDVVEYIESSSWTNFRNQMMDGFTHYNNRKIHAEYDFKKIRRAIYDEFKEEINKDLDQDLLKEVKELRDLIERMRDRL